MVFEALIFLRVPSSSAPMTGPASNTVASSKVSNRIMRASFPDCEWEGEGTVAPLPVATQQPRAGVPSFLHGDARRGLPHVDVGARRGARHHAPRRDEGNARFTQVLHERSPLRAV